MHLQKLTFNLAYILLIGSSILTGFGTLNTFPKEILPLKYILSIETCVTIIASVAYSFLIKSYVTNQNFDLTFYRYLDWFATTPLLLHRPKRKMRQKLTLFFDNVIAPLQA